MKAFIKSLISKRNSEKAPKSSVKEGGWIGVDLDGTLATYDGWYGPAHIGEPVGPMLDRVRAWINEGIEVRVFTARASVPEYVPFVVSWIEKQGLPPLEVTNIKDFAMICLWDDRCVEVVTNEGRPKNKQDDN